MREGRAEDGADGGGGQAQSGRLPLGARPVARGCTRLLQGRQLLACPRTRHGPVRVRVGGRRRGRLLSGARPAARGGTRLLRWAAVAGMISQAQGIAGAGWWGVRETWDHSQA